MKKRPFLLVLLALAFLTATLLPGPTARAAFGQTPDQAPPADTAGDQNYSPPAIEWRSIIFGQSTNQTDNAIAPQSDGSIVISSLNGKGKVTGAHDGIAFYYVTFDPQANNFALAADIEVLTYANDNDPSKPKPNNQKAFGIMVRDTVGAAGDSSVSASNMIYAGGYGAKIAATPLDQKFPAKGSTYRLRVRKTNTGYHLAVSPAASLNASAQDGGGQRRISPSFRIGVPSSRIALPGLRMSLMISQ